MAAKQKRVSLISDIARNRFSYLIALPALVYVAIFSYSAYSYMIIAFQKYDYRHSGFLAMLTRNKWVGLENFRFFFASRNALQVTRNTLYLNFLFIVVGTLVSVLLALMLNELRCARFAKSAQAVMLFPSYISWIVISYILLSLFSNEYGIAVKLKGRLGMEHVNWYTSADRWPAILVIVKTLKNSGMNSIIFLAAIAGIDTTINESARIDGASRFQIATRVTLPLIMPTVMIMTLLSVGRIMYGDFGMIYAFVGDNGTLYRTTDIIDTYLFRALRRVGDPAQAMAIGMFQSVIGFIMVCGSNAIVRRFYPEGALY
jgi:putative aldouronate transport system permease protein